MTIAPRLVWAVEMLAVDTDDRLLEIGCGAGVAVSLACARLRRGTITAIDRSAAMVARARQRNHEAERAGMAMFQHASLETATLAARAFTKVFAFNVTLFGRDPAVQLRILGQALEPDGKLYLFHQPPLAAKTAPWVAATTALLQRHGVRIATTTIHPFDPAPAACIVAEGLPLRDGLQHP